MTYYPYDVLITTKAVIVHFKFIESILTSNVDDDQQMVVDKIKDDTTFKVTTVSGIEHTISVNTLSTLPKNADTDKNNILQRIVDTWIKINKE